MSQTPNQPTPDEPQAEPEQQPAPQEAPAPDTDDDGSAAEPEVGRRPDFIAEGGAEEGAEEGSQLMVTPVPGYGITTPYGRRGPYWGCDEDSQGNGIHTGADYAAPAGTQVVAARGGRAVYCNHGSSFGYHQLEIVPGDGTRDFYAHMPSRAVADGSQVTAGQRIGKVGQKGMPQGPICILSATACLVAHGAAAWCATLRHLSTISQLAVVVAPVERMRKCRNSAALS